jgi:hypothetical protein
MIQAERFWTSPIKINCHRALRFTRELRFEQLRQRDAVAKAKDIAIFDERLMVELAVGNGDLAAVHPLFRTTAVDPSRHHRPQDLATRENNPNR